MPTGSSPSYPRGRLRTAHRRKSKSISLTPFGQAMYPRPASGVIPEAGAPSVAGKDRGDALAAADALRGPCIPAPGTLQNLRRLGSDACARGAERMTQRNGAAIDVDPRLVEAEFAHAGKRLGREGLVEFDDVNLVDGQPCALERLAACRHRTDAHVFWIHPDDRG